MTVGWLAAGVEPGGNCTSTGGGWHQHSPVGAGPAGREPFEGGRWPGGGSRDRRRSGARRTRGPSGPLGRLLSLGSGCVPRAANSVARRACVATSANSSTVAWASPRGSPRRGRCGTGPLAGRDDDLPEEGRGIGGVEANLKAIEDRGIQAFIPGPGQAHRVAEDEVTAGTDIEERLPEASDAAEAPDQTRAGPLQAQADLAGTDLRQHQGSRGLQATSPAREEQGPVDRVGPACLGATGSPRTLRQALLTPCSSPWEKMPAAGSG